MCDLEKILTTCEHLVGAVLSSCLMSFAWKWSNCFCSPEKSMILGTNLIAELDNLFFLLTILVRVKVFRPVVITSGLNREEEEYFAKKTQLPLVAKGRIHSLRGATKTWWWQQVTSKKFCLNFSTKLSLICHPAYCSQQLLWSRGAFSHFRSQYFIYYT